MIIPLENILTILLKHTHNTICLIVGTSTGNYSDFLSTYIVTSLGLSVSQIGFYIPCSVVVGFGCNLGERKAMSINTLVIQKFILTSVILLAFVNIASGSDRYVKDLDDIITDTEAGIQWQVGPDRDTSWNAAEEWVNSLGDDWRMPTRDELRALYDSGITFDNWGPFHNSGYCIWTGEHDSHHAWYCYFWGYNETWDRRVFKVSRRAFAIRSQ